MNPQLQRELQELLSGLCDGELDAAQHARLDTLLQNDAECRQQYLEYMDMHAHLLVHPQFGGVEPALSATALSASPGSLVSPIQPTRPRRVPRVFGYALVALVAVGISVLAQYFFWNPHKSPTNGNSLPAVEGRSAGYIATLTQTADCAWENPRDTRRTGSRLQPGEFRLMKGLAQIRFDSGPQLLLEGPASLRLDSNTAATLLLGKAVFRSDESAGPFDLHTPTATLTDVGTEYAVSVDRVGEEIQVFAGEVQRLPRSTAGHAEPEHVKAGEARRSIHANDFATEPMAFEPERFVRRMSAPGQQPSDGLLAYEGFDYRDPDALQSGKALGGVGWAGPWTLTAAGPPRIPGQKLLALDVEESLDRPGASVQSIGGRFDLAGFAVFYRRLAEPIRLDREGVYYLSFLFRRQGPPGFPSNAMWIMLRPDEEPRSRPVFSNRLMIGVGGFNQVYGQLGLGHACNRPSLPLASGVSYLLVAKIVASSSAPAQVFVRIYGPREEIGSEEPASWTFVSPVFHSDLVFDWLGIHVNSKNRQMIDEIRLGTTWASVTAPWNPPDPAGGDRK